MDVTGNLVPKPYMVSLEKLGNKHLNYFLDKKTAVRNSLMKQDPKRHSVKQSDQRNTMISIFPHIGMVTN